MKKIAFIFIISLIYFKSYSQTVLEQKVIYSDKGVNTDITNGYGVRNLKGLNFDNSYPNVVEIIDLSDNGFIFRNQNKIFLFNNQLVKVAENDISAIGGSGEGKFRFIPTKSGVWIVYEVFSKPSETTIGLLSYNGDLKTKKVELPAKYEFFSGEKNEEASVLALVIAKEHKGTYKLQDLVFDPVSLNYTVKVNRDSALTAPTAFAEMLFYSYYLTPNHNKYKSMLTLNDATGKCELKVWNSNDNVQQSQTSTIVIDEFKNIKKLSDALQFVKDYRLYVNETTGDYTVFHTIMRKAEFLSFNIYKGNFQNKQIIKKAYKKEDLEKYKLTEEYFRRYSIGSIMFNSDESIYDLHDGLLLTFHSRRYFVEPVSGLTIRNLFHLYIKEGEIVRADMNKYSFNCIKHNQLMLLPDKTEEIYKSTSYKAQESDYIYSNIEEYDSKDLLYHVLKRDGYSFVVQIAKENTEVEVTKLSFK